MKQREQNNGDLESDSIAMIHDQFCRLISARISRMKAYQSSQHWEKHWFYKCWQSIDEFTDRFPTKDEREALLKHLEAVEALLVHPTTITEITEATRVLAAELNPQADG